MTIEIKHHSIYSNDPLLERVQLPVSSLRQGYELVIPNSLTLAPYCYVFLQPASTLTNVTAYLNWPVLVAHCQATRRLTVLLVGSEQMLSDEYNKHLGFLRDGQDGAHIEFLLLDPSGQPAFIMEQNISHLGGVGASHHLLFTFRYEEREDAIVFAL
jgi:hypothetical protein